LLAHANKTTVLTAFLKLTQDQRDYYEMKHGFRLLNTGQAEIPPEQINLYDGVNGHVRRDLCGGFGANVFELFRTKRTFLRQEDIERLCPREPNEIQAMLDEIERIL
jgi:hypothetical protein